MKLSFLESDDPLKYAPRASQEMAGGHVRVKCAPFLFMACGDVLTLDEFYRHVAEPNRQWLAGRTVKQFLMMPTCGYHHVMSSVENMSMFLTCEHYLLRWCRVRSPMLAESITVLETLKAILVHPTADLAGDVVDVLIEVSKTSMHYVKECF
jgi:hypothetical protein